MTKLRIRKAECIGCGACAATCEKFFEMAEDGLSHLKGAENSEVENLDVTGASEEDVKAAKEAADVCPVDIIDVED